MITNVVVYMLVGNNPYIGSLEAGLQSFNEEPMYGLVRPPRSIHYLLQYWSVKLTSIVCHKHYST